jgi:hypothetical protein
MAIRGGYAPPGVYTESIFQTTNPETVVSGRLPLLIGTGKETITTKTATVVRGSSANIDQQAVDENLSGRGVLSYDPNGNPVIGEFNGDTTQVQVQHFPIVDGTGTGILATNGNSILATVNGQVTVVLSVNASKGIVTLAQTLQDTDTVLISYYFKRTDTLIVEEDVSSQVSPENAIILGESATLSFNNSTTTFIVYVDGVKYTINTPTVTTNRADDLATIVALINAASPGSLVADTYTDNNNEDQISLTSDVSIKIGNGTANSVLGFVTDQATIRNVNFYTNFFPVVDGSNGGIPTTDVKDITVTVDGVEVVPTSLDGVNGFFTLPTPPAVGAEVLVSYYYNSFRDQFDYLPGTNIISVDSISSVPPDQASNATTFIQGVDCVFKDDKIYWGTVSVVSEGNSAVGSLPLNSQVTANLKDEKVYLAECARVVDTSGNIARALPSTFKLPHQPVDGTGTGTPTSRTDLVQVKVGYGIADALEKANANVIRVNPNDSTITLGSVVPEGQKVYATFYYSTLTDNTINNSNQYVVTNTQAGGSGVGKYTVSVKGASKFGATLGEKGASLDGIDLVFPSGSELYTDAHLQGGKPVNETVTVTFAESDSTSAVFFSPGAEPYFPIATKSDEIALKVDDTALTGNVSFSNSTTAIGATGGFAHLVSQHLIYTNDSNNTTLDFTSGNNSLNLKIDNQDLNVNFVVANNKDVTDIVDALNTWAVDTNTLAAPKYIAMTKMSGGLQIVNGSYDVLSFQYVGNINESTGKLNITVPAGAYATASALATAIKTQIDNAVAALVFADDDFTGLEIGVTETSGHLVFTLLSMPVGTNNPGVADNYGYLEFISQALDTDDFAVIAGIDTDTIDGTQTKFGFLPIASYSRTTLSSGALQDHLILRNRLLPGNSYHLPTGEIGVRVISGTAMTNLGLTQSFSPALYQGAVIESPTLKLLLGWSEGQEVGESQAAVTFYDGTVPSTSSANNVLIIDASGTTVTTQFGATGAGTLTSVSTVASQIDSAFVGAGVDATVSIEGAAVRITLNNPVVGSYLKVLSGSANDTVGTAANVTSTAKSVTASQIVSALMNHYSGTLTDLLFSTGPSANYFASEAVAYVHTASTNKKYVVFESLGEGVASSLAFTGGNAITSKGNGLKIVVGDGAVGEDGINGFYVTSNHPLGSGSSNTSKFNDAIGQDGVVGQTYVDDVTGLTFTVLAQDGGITYPTDLTSYFTWKVSSVFTCNTNIPVNVINGVELIVSNTTGVDAGNSAYVETFDKAGKEPAIGEQYYVTFTRAKTDYSTKVFTTLNDVINEYGSVSTDNSLSLAAYIAFINGASAIACKQIAKQAGQGDLTTAQILTALGQVEGQITTGLSPSVILPLVPANETILSEISKHCDLQSSLRYRSERTAIMGFAAGTTPKEAGRLATLTNSARVRVIYPDITSITLTDALGNATTSVIDGRYLAVAMACTSVNANSDVATPWESRSINGFNGILRTLDAVEANLAAQKGVTILENQIGRIKVRHGLTTNMSSILTRTPTVIQIADEVQLRMRDILDPFIGQKNLPGVAIQIQGQITYAFRNLVNQQIISSFTGISVAPDPVDPTSIIVEAYYKPVFPLLYIQFTFYVRSSD